MGKINLQMYSFMDGKHDDSRENFRTAAGLGYDGVELFGPNFEIPAEELKVYLEELGLEPVSMHAPSADKVIEMIPYAKTMGMKFIGIGMETMFNDADVIAFAEKLNRIGEECKNNGLILTYHNHTQEFLPCDGKRVIDVLMQRTIPEFVSFELDAGWCAAAGFSPLDVIKTYSGRVKLVHIKESGKVIGPQPPMDFSGIEKDENGTPIIPDDVKAMFEEQKKMNCKAGEGIVDWTELKKIADENGCQAYVVEREYSEGDRVDELAADIKYYREVANL